MGNSFLVLITLGLVGCVSMPTATEATVERVVVPIEQPCQVATPERPEFKFKTLTVADGLEKKVRVLLHDRILHEAYEHELETALKACK
jgi:hypothetical protein